MANSDSGTYFDAIPRDMMLRRFPQSTLSVEESALRKHREVLQMTPEKVSFTSYSAESLYDYGGDETRTAKDEKERAAALLLAAAGAAADDSPTKKTKSGGETDSKHSAAATASAAPA